MERKKTHEPLQVEGDLDIFGIAAAWEKLSKGLQKDQLRVDLSQVGDLDTSGMQALQVLAQAAHAHGSSFHLTGAKAGWAERFTLLGFSRLAAAVQAEEHP